MKRRPSEADVARVILAGHRYKSTGRRFGREGHQASSSCTVVTVPRQGSGRNMDEMVDTRKEAVKALQDAVARDAYRVDAVAVAEAILRRLAQGKTI
jgi:anti-sigma28 factor (negative regulator of flagellin synthesis)